MNLIYKINEFAIQFFRKQFFNRVKSNKKVRLPKFIAWDCTRRCNLHCEHCGASKESYAEELTTAEIKKVIDDISGIKRGFFGATGGEPLIRADILDVLAYASEKGLKTGFASNGFLIDQQKAREIKQAKISSIQISLDGDADVHNKIRNNAQSFDRVISAIKNLQEVKIPTVSVATTLTPSNLDQLEILCDLLKKLKVQKWRISVVMPIGRAEDSGNLLLSASQLKELFEFIKINNQKGIYIYMAETLPFLANYEKVLRDGPVLCPVGITACCIGVNGTVRGCPEQPDTPEFIEGTIKEKSILQIWQEGFKKYRLNETVNSDEKCQNCQDKNKCFGGCSVMRLGGNHCIYDLLK
jgi:radical SAM protein with 4Fe4S-binding SPASM domain